MNKFVLISAIATVVHGFLFAVGESTELEEVRKALSAQDVIACNQSLVPVVEKLARGGYFSQGKNKDEIVREILFNALDRRVSINDDQWRKRFSAIEFMMRQSSVFQMWAYDDRMTSKIKLYYCNVKRVPKSDLRAVVEIAREKDAALIASGQIVRPAIAIGHSTTPNLRVARDELDKIRNWNTLVSRHRLIVGRLLSVAVKRNFECLPEDSRMKKYLELVSAADLSLAEIEVLIADAKIRMRLMQNEKSKSSSVETVKLVEGSIRASVAAARTLRVARALIDELVDGVVALDNAEARVPKLKSLAEIVSDWPVDESSPSNHANSHHLRFKMELEVFDGFVKLGKMEDAWRVVLDSMVAYGEVMQKARIRTSRILIGWQKRAACDNDNESFGDNGHLAR